jgi:large subunit ribosomal protein L3
VLSQKKITTMIQSLPGTKVEMSQAFVNDRRVPVTVVKTGPCVVTQIKSIEKDGYTALQLGLSEKRTKNVTKSLQGHLRGVIKDNKAPRFLCEVKVDSTEGVKIGDTILVDSVFYPGDKVAVTGVSKGKGFAGAVKRWHFAGGPKTHGQSDRQRAPGSIGQGTTPGRVLKGKHMAGRMGNDQTTLKNLQIVSVDAEKQEVLLSGPIPGAKGSLVMISLLRAVERPVKEETVDSSAVVEPAEATEVKEANE